MTRRKFLIGAGSTVAVGGIGLGLVEARVLPGRARLNSILGWDGGDLEIPDVESGPISTGTLFSKARGKEVGWTLARPPGVSGPVPLVVALHGRAGSHLGVTAVGADKFLATAVAAGVPPFAIVGVDGDNTYWHRRADGDDPVAMITDEILPLMASQGLPTDRIGLTGWSMGGYGAVRLAQQLGADRIVVACGISPAIFADFASAAAGAFDDEADFQANNVFDGIPALAGIEVALYCGDDDPFADKTEEFLAAVSPRPTGGILAGGHNEAFWHRMAPDQMRILGQALAG